MPLDFENRTDITGDPQPSRTQAPQSMQANTQRKVNRTQQGPQTPQNVPMPGVHRATTDRSTDQAQQQDSQKWLGQTAPNRPYQGTNPVLEQMLNDPWYAYQYGRHIYLGMKAVQSTSRDWASTSVRNLWEMYPVQADIASKALAPIEAVMAPWSSQPGGMSIPVASGVLGNFHGERIGQAVGMGTKDQQKQVTSELAGDVAGAAMDPQTMLGAVAPESKLAWAALYGYGALSNLYESGKTDPTSLLWAGLAGLLTTGKPVPPGAAAVLRKAVPSWDEIQTRVLDRTAKSIAQQHADGTPEGRLKYFDAVVEKIRAEQAVKPYSKVLAEGAKKGAQTFEVTVTDTGEILAKTKEAQDKLDKLLNKFYDKYGVKNLTEFVDKIEHNDIIVDPKKLKKDWQALRMPYDLMATGEGERPLRNPTAHLAAIDDKLASKAATYLSTLRMWADHLHRGPYGNDEQPMVSLWRSMIGFQRSNEFLHSYMIHSMIRLMGEDAGKIETQELLTRAVEGDMDVYDKLAPHLKMIVDGYRIQVATLRRASTAYEMSDSFVPNYFSRVRKIDPKKEGARGRTSEGTSSILQGMSKAHRTVKLANIDVPLRGKNTGTKPAIATTQMWPTVFDQNEAMGAARKKLEADILNGTKTDITEVSAPQVGAIRDLLTKGQAAKARQWAKEAAADAYPESETQFLPAINRSLGRQMSAVHSHQAVKHLLETIWRGKDGKPEPAAVLTKGLDDRQERGFREKGYTEVPSPWFDGTLVNPEMAKLLNRGRQIAALGDIGAIGVLRNIERAMVKGVMYMPQIHAWNIASRLLGAAHRHPVLTTKMLYQIAKGKLGKEGGITEEDWMRMQMEAYRNGVIPNVKHTQFGSDLLAASADVTGDWAQNEYPNLPSNRDIPAWARHPGAQQTFGLGKKMWNGYVGLNNLLWHKTGELGVMMYHLEKESALHGVPALGIRGMDDATASLYAAHRANNWMGHVAPEDSNPFTYDVARLLSFAPNWWRSWAQLFSGYYRRSGFDWTPDRMKLVAMNEIRTAMALYMSQKVSGNMLNLFTSGHLQDQNLPGNQDKVEITSPWLLNLMHWAKQAQDIDAATGHNVKTGARYTIENALSRQMLDTEMAMGYQSGQPGHELFRLFDPKQHLGPIPLGLEVDSPPSPQAVQEGQARFWAGRMAPLTDTAAVFGNVDLYRSLATGQVSHVNPYHDLPGLDSIVMGVLSAAPMGSRVTSETQAQLHQDARQGLPADAPGPFGLPIPRSIVDLGKTFPDATKQNVLSSLAGINPAYEYSQRTAGQPLTDAQYRQVDQVSQDYKSRMHELQVELNTAQISPAIWRQRYQQIATERSIALRNLYGPSTAYVNGTMGLMDRYEALYNDSKVQMPDGTLNLDALAKEQHDFKSKLSAADLAALNSQLARNDHQYPALKQYHDAVQSYHDFQAQWAAAHGIDPFQLQQEGHEYGQKYSNTQLRAKFISQHPEYMQWTAAKKQWERSVDGMPYGLFFDVPTSVNAAYAQGLDLNTLEQMVHSPEAQVQQEKLLQRTLPPPTQTGTPRG